MSHVKLAVYVTTQNLMKYSETDEELARMISEIKDAGASKAVLEVWRGGTQTDAERHRKVRDAFIAAGLEVATGIMPVRGGDISLVGTDDFKHSESIGGNSRWAADICYSRPWSREVFRAAMKAGAELFDEFVIDDALTTQCTCRYCREKKGDRSWSQFRRDLLLEVSKEDIVGLCKETNPNIKVILKFPQWYDRLHLFGYDTERQPAEFDATWVGTETRDPDTALFGYCPQYEACFNVRWHREACPSMEATWFDFYDCDKHIYVEQAYQSVLGGARNLTLFCYSSGLFREEQHGFLPYLKEQMPKLEKIAETVGDSAPTGVVTVRPHNAEAHDDGYVFDVLGMVGFPLVPRVSWPEETPDALLLTAHMAGDPDLTKKVAEVVEEGGVAFLTANLMALRDEDNELKRLAGLQDDGWVEARRWESGTFIVNGKQLVVDPITWRYDIRVETAEILAGVMPRDSYHGSEDPVPVVTIQRHPSGGAVVVLNIWGAGPEDFPMDESLNVPIEMAALNFPPAVLNVIQGLIGEATGRAFIAPARVAYYPFSNGSLVVQNFRDVPVFATTSGQELSEGEEELLGDATILRGGDITGIYLPPRSVALVR